MRVVPLLLRGWSDNHGRHLLWGLLPLLGRDGLMGMCAIVVLVGVSWEGRVLRLFLLLHVSGVGCHRRRRWRWMLISLVWELGPLLWVILLLGQWVLMCLWRILLRVLELHRWGRGWGLACGECLGDLLEKLHEGFLLSFGGFTVSNEILFTDSEIFLLFLFSLLLGLVLAFHELLVLQFLCLELLVLLDLKLLELLGELFPFFVGCLALLSGFLGHGLDGGVHSLQCGSDGLIHRGHSSTDDTLGCLAGRGVVGDFTCGVLVLSLFGLARFLPFCGLGIRGLVGVVGEDGTRYFGSIFGFGRGFGDVSGCRWGSLDWIGDVDFIIFIGPECLTFEVGKRTGKCVGGVVEGLLVCGGKLGGEELLGLGHTGIRDYEDHLARSGGGGCLFDSVEHSYLLVSLFNLVVAQLGDDGSGTGISTRCENSRLAVEQGEGFVVVGEDVLCVDCLLEFIFIEVDVGSNGKEGTQVWVLFEHKVG